MKEILGRLWRKTRETGKGIWNKLHPLTGKIRGFCGKAWNKLKGMPLVGKVQDFCKRIGAKLKKYPWGHLGYWKDLGWRVCDWFGAENSQGVWTIHWKRMLLLGAVIFLVWTVSADFKQQAVNTYYSDLLVENADIQGADNFFESGTLTLTGVEGLSRAYIQRNLQLTPDSSFMVTKASVEADTALVQVRSVSRSTYNISLVEPYGNQQLSWTIPGPPFTVSLSAETVGTSGPILLELSEPVSEYVLGQNLRFSPSFTFTVEMRGNTAHIIPDGTLRSGYTYTLGVSEDLVSLTGNRVDRGYVFRVATQRSSGSSYLESYYDDYDSYYDDYYDDYPDDYPDPYDGDARTPDYNSGSFSVSMTNAQVQMLSLEDRISLEFETRRAGDGVPLTVTVYQFPSVERYLDQSEMLINYSFDPADILERVDIRLDVLQSGLQKVEFQNPGQYGGYLIEATIQHPETGNLISMRKAVFITDMSLYMQALGTNTLAWLNNSSTGEMVSGYTVEFLLDGEEEPFASGVTDAQGVTSISTILDQEDYYYDNDYVVVLRNGDGEVVYADNTRILNTYYYGDGGNKYYSFFYTDRAIYKPTDEIYFWGFIQPHVNNSGEAPTQVKVSLSGQDISVVVDLDEYGTFTGMIEIDQIKSSQYYLTVTLPDVDTSDEYAYYQSIESTYIDVKDYKKPLFTLDSSIDKQVYLDSETVNVRITPQFYDGTPLPNYDLEFSVYDTYYGSEGTVTTVTTDADGIATVQFPANQIRKSEMDWKPVATRYKVKIASDGENITHYGSYVVLPTDLMVESSFLRQLDGNVQLILSTSEITLSGVPDLDAFGNDILGSYTANSYYYYGYTESEPDYSVLRGGSKNAEVEVELTYEYRDTDGRYHTDTTVVEDQTQGSVLRLASILPDDFDSSASYSVSASIVAKDDKRRSIVAEDYYSYHVPGSTSRSSRTGDEEEQEIIIPGYSFAVTDAEGNSRLTSEYYEYLSYNSASFDDREEMNFSLLYDSQPVANQGRLLYTLIQNNVIERGIESGDALQLTQSVRYAQSVTLVAAYFDGNAVYPIRDTEINFNQQSAKLEIDVTADKVSYQPGETVTLNVTVTEATTGNGVSGNALISVVDESVFALREQYITVLSDLFGDMYFSTSYIPKYTTTTGDLSRPGGYDGGKGGDGAADFYDILRKNFKDTATFLPVRTDASGNATVTFQLPDNTTSWRITALSISDGLYAGNSKSHIISTLPFFVNPVVSSKYLEGDDIALLVQGHGTALDEESQISYSATIRGDGVNQTITDDGPAFRSRQVNFGQLPMGEYTLSVTAQYSGYRDTVELPVYVISSNLELVVNKEIDLQSPLEISAMRYPVTISFYDAEFEPYYKSVSSLLTHYCMIANQRMSRFVAKRALSAYMDEDAIPQHIQADDDTVANMQNADGGIGWNEGSESEPLVTTKVLLVAGDQFSHKDAIRYYRGVLENQKGLNVAAAYLGLAYLGEPVVDDVVSQLESSDLTLEEEAYLIAALAYAGETETALFYYQADIAPLIKEVKVGSSIVRPPLSSDHKRAKRGGALLSYDNEDAKITAAAWIAASRLGLEDADQFSLYFANASWRIDTLFECMIYVTNYDREVTPSVFTYQVGGEERTVNLGLRGQQTVAFNRSEMESLELGNVPDAVRATAYYIGEPAEVEIEPSDKISISKKITEIQDGRYQVRITVDLAPGSQSGYYDISEWVPSNMRLYGVQQTLSTDNYDFSYSTENQKITFRIYRHHDVVEPASMVISYTAQKTFDSTAVVDSTYIIHGNSGENNYTQRYVLELEEEGEEEAGDSGNPSDDEPVSPEEPEEPEE